MTALKNTRFHLIAILILAGALSRLIPHPANFTAIAATGIFGGFYLKNFKQAVFVVLGAMFFSDLLIGFSTIMPVVYIALLIPIALGQKAQKSSRMPWLIGGTLASSPLFFIMTNFYVWAVDSLYPKTLSGLILCYEAALPFLTNQLAGDLLYTVGLFGILYIFQLKFPYKPIRII